MNISEIKAWVKVAFDKIILFVILFGLLLSLILLILMVGREELDVKLSLDVYQFAPSLSTEDRTKPKRQ